MTKYRIINWQDIHVLPGHENTVAQLLNKAGWESMPTNTEKGMLIAPRPQEYVAQSEESIQILREIAPHLQDGEHMILEKTNLQDWLHLIYESQSVREIATPAQQWQV